MGGGHEHSCLLQRRNPQNKHKHELARISKNYFSCFIYYRQHCESVHDPHGVAPCLPMYMPQRGVISWQGAFEIAGLFENSVNLPIICQFAENFASGGLIWHFHNQWNLIKYIKWVHSPSMPVAYMYNVHYACALYMYMCILYMYNVHYTCAL